jgi:hypothetical protein
MELAFVGGEVFREVFQVAGAKDPVEHGTLQGQAVRMNEIGLVRHGRAIIAFTLTLFIINLF